MIVKKILKKQTLKSHCGCTVELLFKKANSFQNRNGKFKKEQGKQCRSATLSTPSENRGLSLVFCLICPRYECTDDSNDRQKELPACFFILFETVSFALGMKRLGFFQVQQILFRRVSFFSCFLFSVPFPNLIALFFCLFFFLHFQLLFDGHVQFTFITI